MEVGELKIDMENVDNMLEEMLSFIKNDLRTRLFKRNKKDTFTSADIAVVLGKLAVQGYGGMLPNLEMSLTLGMHMHSNMSKTAVTVGCPCCNCTGNPMVSPKTEDAPEEVMHACSKGVIN